MIESGFRTDAYSSAAAVGLWQFSSTGREHKMRIDWWVDERRDPEIATDVAIVFLRTLHQNLMIGTWRGRPTYGGPGREIVIINKTTP